MAPGGPWAGEYAPTTPGPGTGARRLSWRSAPAPGGAPRPRHARRSLPATRPPFSDRGLPPTSRREDDDAACTHAATDHAQFSAESREQLTALPLGQAARRRESATPTSSSTRLAVVDPTRGSASSRSRTRIRSNAGSSPAASRSSARVTCPVLRAQRARTLRALAAARHKASRLYPAVSTGTTGSPLPVRRWSPTAPQGLQGLNPPAFQPRGDVAHTVADRALEPELGGAAAVRAPVVERPG